VAKAASETETLMHCEGISTSVFFYSSYDCRKFSVCVSTFSVNSGRGRVAAGGGTSSYLVHSSVRASGEGS
jgi:hypothetical protein